MNIKKRLLCGLFLIWGCLAWGQKNPCNPTGAPYTSLPGDTTLILKGGTQVTFNRCEYFDLRDCLEFDEIFDQESIVSSGLVTQDEQGNILISCGMFRIRLTSECSGKTCFDVPVRIRMPYRVNFSSPAKEDSCALCGRNSVRLFTSDGGAWSDSTTLQYKTIEIGGQKYFEFFVTCANKFYNCDCRHNSTTKVKFKARRGERLEEVAINITCPVSVLKFVSRKPRRKMIVKLPCRYSDVIVRARGTNRSGEAFQFGPRHLSQLNHGLNRKNCKIRKGKVIRRILGIFPIREGFYFRKYFTR